MLLQERKNQYQRYKHIDQKYYQTHRKKMIERTYQRQLQDPQKWMLQFRKGAYKRLYNITLEQYDEMLAAQNGLCYICKKSPKKNKLSVDHNHQTKRVRKLLCWRCNTGIGFIESSLYESFLDYLKEHSI